MWPYCAGTRAAGVSTLIDMSTREGAAYFSDIAAAQPQEAGHLPQTLYFTDTHANCIRQWTSTGVTRSALAAPVRSIFVSRQSI